ncbi:zinc-binding dehydrogenase [Microbacterium sp. ARD31]|uniref:quinone oxidoreductase family protein n=1 Tax=Microbacterium sp. ARD31 TaxID=2962576 RepID=UPI00288127CD|nr:zinc-binding dehydrogenase [Microbacterium sp. ARD31]MDT0183944.1 zinc-binding dehydrogenase [Microbacterium sp. ARD31]
MDKEVQWPSVDGGVPSEMHATAFAEFGGPEVLKDIVVPTPQPGRGEVLVKVAAVSVGRLLDLIARSGKHPYATFELPHILGADHAGTIAAVGEGVDNVVVGDHVAGFHVIFPVEDEYTRSGYGDLSPSVKIIGTHVPGADGEYVVVPAVNVRVVPEGIGPVMAASIIGVGPVAMNQFERAGGVGAGSNVIVQGATSGLGATTAMLAKHLGATVVVTSRHESKRERLRELGFEHVFDAIDEDFADRAREAFGGDGAHVVVDNLGAPLIWEHGFAALRPGGAMVSSGAFLGHVVPLNLQRAYTQGMRVIGVRTGTLGTVDRVWAEAERGYRTVVDATFPIENAPDAHRFVERAGNVGRVVMTRTH